MPRKNRVSVPNGTYHITSRIVNRERWLRDPRLKDEIVEWLYGVAAFSGVELLSWCIMDNHFHVLAHVPEVPREFWTDPDSPPASHAFNMRPAECRTPRWSPPSDGDSPHAGDGFVRPEVGFTLPDDEMLRRLTAYYGNETRAKATLAYWERLRAEGNEATAEADRARYLRRMYNVSQFAKTLKERIARVVNKRTGHVGHVFEGRFHSALVQGDAAVEHIVSLYVDYNPHKAKMLAPDERYRWSSFGQAEGTSPHAESCRRAYERIWSLPWAEARRQILAAFAAKLPEGDDVEGRVLAGKLRVTPAQLVKLRIPTLSRGAFIGRAVSFVQEVAAQLPRTFPRAGSRSLRRFVQMVEWAHVS